MDPRKKLIMDVQTVVGKIPSVKYVAKRVVPVIVLLFALTLGVQMVYREMQSSRTLYCRTDIPKLLRMNHLLRTVTEALNKYNVTHWIDYGTLLGAYRYKNIIPWDHDMDIGYRVEDIDKVALAAQEVSSVQGFKMSIEIASYNNQTFLDLFRWQKVRKNWSLKSIYNWLTSTPDTDDNFEMNVIMPEEFKLYLFLRNSFMDNFPYRFVKSLTTIKVSNLTVPAPNHYKEFLQLRYYWTFNYVIPYCIHTKG